MKKPIIFSALIAFSILSISAGSLVRAAGPNVDSAASNLPSFANPLDYLNDLTRGLSGVSNITGNVGAAIPGLSKLQDQITSSFSSNDITGALKSFAALAINLFLIVIQTVAGILKALLPFLSK